MSIANTDQTNDKLLLLQVEKGNKHAFNVLYEKYWEQAYSNAYKRLKDADQAMDIVQDIFVNIWLKRQTPINNLPAYLNVAVRNRVFKYFEQQKKTVAYLDILENIPSANQQPERDILWTEFLAAYEALIATLPPKRREIFRLRYHEDLTTKAIGSQLGLSRKTIQNQLGKAIEQLRVSMLQLFSFLLIFLF
jgi:RNA polymerase sigma-70 factor (family 1)